MTTQPPPYRPVAETTVALAQRVLREHDETVARADEAVSHAEALLRTSKAEYEAGRARIGSVEYSEGWLIRKRQDRASLDQRDGVQLARELLRDVLSAAPLSDDPAHTDGAS